ncbi:MAG: hypothetical protein KatS3mg105_5082 [Gemmatales bacterium]|nr:MAG: hypothetical protein KatS3mg105_5082 [Gemmatales bacterium]
MNVVAWAQYHYRSLIFLLLAFVVGGVVSGLGLPVALLPHVNFPRIQTSLDAGDRPAERMVTEVTYPVEEALRAIPGVRGVRSTTSRGSAEVSVNFDWGEDMTSAKLQVESQINRLLPSLPPGTVFDVRRMDPTVFPVIAYSLTSKSLTQSELYDLAQYQLRPKLSAITGVAQIVVQGGQVQEYQVIVHPDKLRTFGMTVNDVATALSASNVLQAVGRLEDHDKLYLLVSDTRFQSADQIGESLLRSGPHRRCHTGGRGNGNRCSRTAVHAGDGRWNGCGADASLSAARRKHRTSRQRRPRFIGNEGSCTGRCSVGQLVRPK